MPFALSTFLKKLGSKLAARRRENNLTQEEAAKKAEIPYRYFQSIESGKVNLTLSTLLRLARSLRAHPAELIPGQKEWSWAATKEEASKS
jgi:transcriptional regulator with XRE-family HTH domain